MVLVERVLNTEQVSLMRPIYIEKYILVLKQVVLIERMMLILSSRYNLTSLVQYLCYNCEMKTLDERYVHIQVRYCIVYATLNVITTFVLHITHIFIFSLKTNNLNYRCILRHKQGLSPHHRRNQQPTAQLYIRMIQWPLANIRLHDFAQFVEGGLLCRYRNRFLNCPLMVQKIFTKIMSQTAVEIVIIRHRK